MRVLFHADGYKSGDEKVLEAKIETVLNVGAAVPATAALSPCPPPPAPFRFAGPAPFILNGGLMQ